MISNLDKNREKLRLGINLMISTSVSWLRFCTIAYLLNKFGYR